MGGYDAPNLNVCETLYAAGAGRDRAVLRLQPRRQGRRRARAARRARSPISGLAFYSGGAFPAAYTDALFFADYSRKCIWVMYRGADGLPDPGHAHRRS